MRPLCAVIVGAVMTKYTISLTATYELKGQMLKEYLDWLDGYKDTEKMRKAFITDRFISPEFMAVMQQQKTLIDLKKVALKIKKEN